MYTRQWGPYQTSAHFFYAWTFAVDTCFDIEPHKQSQFTKLGAQTQHRVMQRFVPPSASKQSEITCEGTNVWFSVALITRPFPAALMVDPSRNNVPTIVRGVYCDTKQFSFSSEIA